MAEFQSIPLSALRESPFNPRKTYPEAELLELAESIRTQGVMQPIVVRIKPEELNAAGHFEYEIIFGHRRARAAALAELEAVPAIVREMSDEGAAIAQVHENMKRTDVTALEEADSYVHLRNVHRMKGEDIAAAVGKTKSYVYARLKLASAAPEVRTAVLTRNMSAEIALLIGRLPHHDLQRAALKQVRAPSYEQVEGEPEKWRSVRDTKRELKQLFENDVDVAQFSTSDETLIESAGACTNCPKRAGNMDGLAEILDAGICTDAVCYQAKQKAFVWLRTDELREAGRTVIEGEAAREIMPHGNYCVGHRGLQGTVYDPATNAFVEMASVLERPGAPAVLPTIIVNPHDGLLKEVVTDDQWSSLERFVRGEAARSPGATERDRERAAKDAEREAMLAALPRAQRACLDPTIMVDVRRAVLMAMVESPRSVDELRHIVLREMEMGDADLGMAGEVLGLRALASAAELEAGDDFSEFDWYSNWARTVATADQLGALVAMLGVEDALGTSWRDESDDGAIAARRVAIAQAYGIDPADFLAEEDPAPPSTAARAQKGAGGKAGKKTKRAAPAGAGVDLVGDPIVKDQSDDAGSAGDEAKDEPADAGVARDPNTSDMFDGAPA